MENEGSTVPVESLAILTLSGLLLFAGQGAYNTSQVGSPLLTLQCRWAVWNGQGDGRKYLKRGHQWGRGD